MEGALSWIGDLIELFISFIPHLGLCRANHGGVKFIHGKKVTVIKPGLFWHWPIVTEIELIPVARQTMNLESQTLTTSDDRIVTVSSVVIYRVEDVRKALVDSWDMEDTISDVALKSNVDAIVNRTFAKVKKELTGQVEKDIVRSCRKALKPYGIRVDSAFLTDFAETEVYRIVGALPTGTSADG